MTGPNSEFGERRACPACGRALPVDIPPEACPGCTADGERERRRQDHEAARKRLGLSPYTKASQRARWGLLAVLEDLNIAIKFAPGDADADRLRRALVHAGRASGELGAGT